MKKLQLSLKKQWFDMTKARIKEEEYREITPYWCNRLLLFDGKQKSKLWWSIFLDFNSLSELMIYGEAAGLTMKVFKSNIMTLGYPKSTYKERILKLKHEGIEIRTGNPEWGADPDKLYFVIKHGEIID